MTGRIQHLIDNRTRQAERHPLALAVLAIAAIVALIGLGRPPRK